MYCFIMKRIWIFTSITPILAGILTRCLVHVTRLRFRFAPRLRDLGDRKLYTSEKTSSYPDLSLLIGGTVNVRQITEHWDELLRLTASLRLGTVTASLMLRKLASYPRQNGLAWALREVGRIEKTLFTLEWFQSLELRRRGQVCLTKGEGRHTPARAGFFFLLRRRPACTPPPNPPPRPT